MSTFDEKLMAFFGITQSKSCQYYADSNMITAAGCKYLATMCWKRLDTLNMGNNRIMDRGCKELIASEWPGLFLLNLCRSTLTKIAIKSKI